MSEQELREDISVLNVVNFGGGAYVIYAEVLPTGEIEVDPEPYSDTFDRPARLLPIEAQRARRGDRPDRPHLPGRAALGAREDRRRARPRPRRGGPAVTAADAPTTIARTRRARRRRSARLLELEY